MKRSQGEKAGETRQEEIQALLQELTEWRRLSGFDPEEAFPGEVRSTGESNAAILELRRRLRALGARFHWQPERQEYVLEEPEPPRKPSSHPTSSA